MPEELPRPVGEPIDTITYVVSLENTGNFNEGRQRYSTVTGSIEPPVPLSEQGLFDHCQAEFSTNAEQTTFKAKYHQYDKRFPMTDLALMKRVADTLPNVISPTGIFPVIVRAQLTTRRTT